MNQSIARPTEPAIGSLTSPYVRNLDWLCLLSAAVMLAATPQSWLSGTTRPDIASWWGGPSEASRCQSINAAADAWRYAASLCARSPTGSGRAARSGNSCWRFQERI